MISNIIADLKLELPEIFDDSTELEVEKAVEQYVEEFKTKGWELPQYEGNARTLKFKRIVRRYVKIPKPPKPYKARRTRSTLEQKKEAQKRAIKKYQSKPEYKIAHSLRRRLWFVMQGKRKDCKMLELLGCTLAEFKVYLESQFDSKMTWDNYGEWHIDHIVPLCSVDVTNNEELKKVSHYSNLRPYWALDNKKKVKYDKLQSIRKK